MTALPDDRHIHECDCPEGNRCEYCGCCYHCDGCRDLCKVTRAPRGMPCPEISCGCQGES
jgi:hypothetical protein